MALMKCPECEREISDKAEKCPHCGNPLGVAQVPPQASAKSQERSKTHPVAWIVLALLIGGAVWLWHSSDGFNSEANVDAAKKTIRTMWEKEGFTVTEIQMVRETSKKLSGYVNLEKKVSLLPMLKVTKHCTATMDTNGEKFLTQCE